MEIDNNSAQMFMAAIDGGYCTLKHDERLTIVFASNKVGRVLGADTVLALTDFMSKKDKDEFFKAYKPVGNFSVKCNLTFENRLVPTTLKCHSNSEFIFCDITMQMDWYRYAEKIVEKNINYGKLLDYTDSYLFAVDTNWNFIVVSSQFRNLFKLDGTVSNFELLLTEEGVVHPSCSKVVKDILTVNALTGKRDTYRIQIKDGKEWNWFRLELNTIFDKEANKIANIVGSFVRMDKGDNDSKIFTPSFACGDFLNGKLSDNTWAVKLSFRTNIDLSQVYSPLKFEQLEQRISSKYVEIGRKYRALIVKVSNQSMIFIIPNSNKDDVVSLMQEAKQVITEMISKIRVSAVVTESACKNKGGNSDVATLLDSLTKFHYSVVSKKEGCMLIDSK